MAAASVRPEVERKPVTIRKVGTEEIMRPSKTFGVYWMEDVREHAPSDVRNEAVQLLTEFLRRVRELDLGNFDALEHQIHTGDARLVKQRMRRNPTAF